MRLQRNHDKMLQVKSEKINFQVGDRIEFIDDYYMNYNFVPGRKKLKVGRIYTVKEAESTNKTISIREFDIGRMWKARFKKHEEVDIKAIIKSYLT